MVKKADFTPEESRNILIEPQRASRHVSLSCTSGVIREKKK
jgi:hypothetical protein